MRHSPVQRWFLQAKEDLKSAELTIGVGRYYVVALLAQQAAEKALKALYIAQTNELPPKTHDLLHLGSLTKVPSSHISSLELLDPTYLNSRYPDAQGRLPAKNTRSKRPPNSSKAPGR